MNALCERMWLNRVRRRQILYVEGNRATHFYAVRSGKVKLVRIIGGGREHVTAILEAGDLFGFEAVFDDSYSSDAVTLTDAELCLVSGAELSELTVEVPRLMTDIARYLSFQLCRTRHRQAWLTASSASAKLAGYLLQGLRSHGAPDDDSTVAGDLTLRDLAGILGMAPETVCRARRDLAERGIIETLPSGVRVRDQESLRRVAGH
ncbi:MAG: Crp/Fnr family transcriptional regulator [Gemmatimonadales bacterium]